MKPEDTANGNTMAVTTTAVTNGQPKLGKLLNGSNKPAQNGHTNGNTEVKPDTKSTTYLGHSREELARLMIQTLQGMGYTSAAAELTRESGFQLENPSVAQFRKATLEGDWPEVEHLLFKSAEERDAAGSSDLVLNHSAPASLMKFWIRQQKFLELLEARDVGSAVTCLRGEITPENPGMPIVHALSR